MLFPTLLHGCADHKCGKPGCVNTLVLDGNLKNCRAVLSATHAGYIEYKDLPGQVRSGCQNAPDSSFCQLHKPMLAMPQHIPTADDAFKEIQATEEEPAAIITSKRKTRNSTL